MRRALLLLTGLLLTPLFYGCGPAASSAEGELTIYSGRSKALVEPLIERFEQETGIRVRVRYGDTAQLASALAEEGRRTPADVFWAQDAGALGSIDASGMLAMLPDSLLARVPDMYEGSSRTWVATSGRARSLVYSSLRVRPNEIPTSIFDLADPRYAGRVGWAPTNASFHAFVTALRLMAGDERTREWLTAVRNNGARSYQRNTALVQAIADGEIDFALSNHYYLIQLRHADPNFPVEQTTFAAGDPGNLVNVAGIAVLGNSTHQEEAHRFISFLLSHDSQAFFVNETFEYSVIEDGPESASTRAVSAVQPAFDLDALRDLPATLDMLRRVGLL
jgi:iron(III) transport system substrate-binding protein